MTANPSGNDEQSGFARALQEGYLRLADPGGPTGLRRFTAPRQRPRPGENCELCATPLADEHAHVVDTSSRALKCTCRPCALLFTHEGAAGGKYRAVPERYLHDPAFALTDAQWDAVQIPVRMAFFFRNSTLDKTVCFYPSPGGATESLLDLDAWAEVMAANPAVADAEPDVEALLIQRTAEGDSAAAGEQAWKEGAFECFLVPIDACYELVGRVKLRWQGFSGGAEVWADLDEFFAGLRARSRRVGAEARS